MSITKKTFDKLEKRVANLESVVRNNYASGNDKPKLSLYEDKESSNGGYVTVACGGCGFSLGNYYTNQVFNYNHCHKCGIKADFNTPEFEGMIKKLKLNSVIYSETKPLKDQIETLKSKKK